MKQMTGTNSTAFIIVASMTIKRNKTLKHAWALAPLFDSSRVARGTAAYTRQLLCMSFFWSYFGVLFVGFPLYGVVYFSTSIYIINNWLCYGYKR